MILRRGVDLRLDLGALLGADVADLQHRIDEKAQPQLGRQPARARMRRIDEAKLLKVLHDIADGGGRQGHRQKPRQMPRAHRLAIGEIGFDDMAEDLARPLVQRAESGHIDPQIFVRILHEDTRPCYPNAPVWNS